MAEEHTQPDQPGTPAPDPAPPNQPPPPPGHQPPHAGEDPAVRQYAMLTHLSGLAALLGFPVLGPLIMWLIKKDESAYINAHGKEALNSQLTFFIAGIVFGVVSVLFVVVTVGFGACVVAPLAMLFAAWPIVTSIVGAMQANEGKPPRVPLTIRIIS